MLVLDRTYLFEGHRVAWGRIGRGPPLVLIHGTPFSSQVWRRIAPLLARHWTVHTFDLLGYGVSEMREGQDVSLGVQNRLLASLFLITHLPQPNPPPQVPVNQQFRSARALFEAPQLR